MPKFEVIEDNEPNEPARTVGFDGPVPTHLLDTLLEGVKALPKQTAHVIARCFALVTVATVFWLALLIVPYTPNAYQLVGLGGYALFVIALNVITRR
jgi:hypothetical protein